MMSWGGATAMKEDVTVFSFGAQVQTPHGTAGRIHSLLIDRSRRRLLALVLRRGLPRNEVVLPAGSIDPHDMTDEHLYAPVPGALALLPRGYSIDDVCTTLDEHALASSPSSW